MLDPVTYARMRKEKRARRRAYESERARAAMLAALASESVQRELEIAARQVIARRELREAIARFVAKGGPALFKRIAVLEVLAGQGVLHVRPQHEHRELGAALRKLVPVWPRSVVQESVLIDAVQYTRSPVGLGAKRMVAGEREWQDKRIDVMGLERTITWAEQQKFIERVVNTPPEQRGSLLVSHIKTYGPPSVSQMLWWYRNVNQRLGSIQRGVEKLERHYRHQLHAWAGAFHEEIFEPDTTPAQEKKRELIGMYATDRTFYVYERATYRLPNDSPMSPARPTFGDYIGNYRTKALAEQILGQEIAMGFDVFYQPKH